MLTLRDLYEVNIGLAQPGAPISFYDVEKGIVSAAPVRPPAIIHNCDIENTLIGEGSVLHVRCILRADDISDLTPCNHKNGCQRCARLSRHFLY